MPLFGESAYKWGYGSDSQIEGIPHLENSALEKLEVREPSNDQSIMNY